MIDLSSQKVNVGAVLVNILGRIEDSKLVDRVLLSLTEYDDVEIWKKIDASIVLMIVDKGVKPESVNNEVLHKIILLGNRDAVLSFAPRWIEKDMDILDAVVRRFDQLHETYQSRLISEYLETSSGPPLAIFFDLWHSDKDTKKDTILDIVTRIVKRGITDGLDDGLLLRLAGEKSGPYLQSVGKLVDALPNDYPKRGLLIQALADSKLDSSS